MTTREWLSIFSLESYLMTLPRLLCGVPAVLSATLLLLSVPAQRWPDMRVDHAPVGATVSKSQIAASSSSIYVTWEDARNGLGDVFLTYSRDGGGTWRNADVQINTTTGAAGSGDPDMVVSGSSVYVVYDGDGGVRFNRSLDDGATWLVADLLLAPLGSSLPVIAESGSTVYVVYRRASSPSFNNDLYFRRSLDSGATWQPEIRLDTDAPQAGDSIRSVSTRLRQQNTEITEQLR